MPTKKVYLLYRVYIFSSIDTVQGVFEEREDAEVAMRCKEAEEKATSWTYRIEEWEVR